MRRFTNICRICAEMKTDQMVELFGKKGIENKLAEKIDKYLPNLKISEQDNLPHSVCYQCSNILTTWHNLYERSEQSDAELRKAFYSNKDSPFEEGSVSDNASEGIENSGKEENKKKRCRERISVAVRCPFCDAEFVCGKSIVKHFKSVHPLELIRNCPYCESVFFEMVALMEHISTEHAFAQNSETGGAILENSFAIKCDTVERTSSRLCEKCGQKLSSENAYKNHLWKHEMEKGLACAESNCKYRCHTLKQLKSHLLVHNKRFNCDACDSAFAYNFQLKNHVEAKHNKTRSFECSICKKAFSSQANLTSHITFVHKSRLNFKCEKCEFKGKSNSDLSVHRRTHSKEKPFKCSVCEYCAVTSRDCLRHEKLHQKYGPKFSKLWKLNLGKNSYKCDSNNLSPLPERVRMYMNDIQFDELNGFEFLDRVSSGSLQSLADIDSQELFLDEALE